MLSLYLPRVDPSVLCKDYQPVTPTSVDTSGAENILQNYGIKNLLYRYTTIGCFSAVAVNINARQASQLWNGEATLLTISYPDMVLLYIAGTIYSSGVTFSLTSNIVRTEIPVDIGDSPPYFPTAVIPSKQVNLKIGQPSGVSAADFSVRLIIMPIASMELQTT